MSERILTVLMRYMSTFQLPIDAAIERTAAHLDISPAEVRRVWEAA